MWNVNKARSLDSLIIYFSAALVIAAGVGACLLRGFFYGGDVSLSGPMVCDVLCDFALFVHWSGEVERQRVGNKWGTHSCENNSDRTFASSITLSDSLARRTSFGTGNNE